MKRCLSLLSVWDRSKIFGDPWNGVGLQCNLRLRNPGFQGHTPCTQFKHLQRIPWAQLVLGLNDAYFHCLLGGAKPLERQG